jgi:hypothetical protein
MDITMSTEVALTVIAIALAVIAIAHVPQAVWGLIYAVPVAVVAMLIVYGGPHVLEQYRQGAAVKERRELARQQCAPGFLAYLRGMEGFPYRYDGSVRVTDPVEMKRLDYEAYSEFCRVAEMKPDTLIAPSGRYVPALRPELNPRQRVVGYVLGYGLLVALAVTVVACTKPGRARMERAGRSAGRAAGALSRRLRNRSGGRRFRGEAIHGGAAADQGARANSVLLTLSPPARTRSTSRPERPLNGFFGDARLGPV